MPASNAYITGVGQSEVGVKLTRHYNLDAPKGVNGRNSDNTLILERLGWEPSIKLRDGMEKTYRWIEEQIATGTKGK